MTIKDVEAQTGMEESGIQLYEREGLITSQTLEDGEIYYSEEVSKIILKIKLLRLLHISLDEIKIIRYGNKTLLEVLKSQIEALKYESNDLLYVIQVCRTMQEAQVTFEDLDAPKYIELLEQTQNITEQFFDTLEVKAESQAFHPWRRFFARTLDISLYRAIWIAVLIFVLHVSMLKRDGLWNLFDVLIGLGLTLLIEPLLLHKFGTTFGKFIFGIKVEHTTGRKLSYAQGLDRTWQVICKGLGFNIPIYNLVRLWKSYKLCEEKVEQPWNAECAYTIKDTKWYRGVGFIGSYMALLGLIVLLMMTQQLPPNRGDITQAEFIENYNYYVDYFGVGLGSPYLDDNGDWVDESYDYRGMSITISSALYTQKPKFVFVSENGYLTGVSFDIDIEGDHERLTSYENYMMLAELSFASAQDGVNVFSKLPEKLVGHMPSNPFQDFHFSEVGIEFDCQVEYSGYLKSNSYFLYSNEHASDHFLKLNFSMKKVN